MATYRVLQSTGKEQEHEAWGCLKSEQKQLK